MMSIGDVVRYVPGITAHQGENNRDQIIIRGNSSSADFFVERRARRRAVLSRSLQPGARRGAQGVERDDLRSRRRRRRHQPRDQGSACSGRFAKSTFRAARIGNKRFTADVDQPLERQGGAPRSTACTRTPIASGTTSSSSATASIRRSRSRRAARHETDASATSICATAAWPIAASRRSRAGRPTSTSRRSTAIPTRATCDADVNLGVGDRSSIGSGGVTVRNRTLVRRLRSLLPELRPGRGRRQTGRRSRSRAYNNATDRTNVFNQTDVTGCASNRARCGTRCSWAPSSVGS